MKLTTCERCGAKLPERYLCECGYSVDPAPHIRTKPSAPRPWIDKATVVFILMALVFGILMGGDERDARRKVAAWQQEEQAAQQQESGQTVVAARGGSR